MKDLYDQIDRALNEVVSRAQAQGAAKCGEEFKNAYAIGYFQSMVKGWLLTLPDAKQRSIIQEIQRSIARFDEVQNG